MNAIETEDFGDGYVGSIYHDGDARYENDLGAITYKNDARHVLGTEGVDLERFEEIGAKIESGEYIGLPVYAYVHSGETISTSPFSCPWDSGRSGWAYLTTEQAIHEWGEKGGELTEHVREKAHQWLEGIVVEYASYLEGDVHYYKIEDSSGNEVDSCGGILGLDDARKMMQENFEQITSDKDALGSPKG